MQNQRHQQAGKQNLCPVHTETLPHDQLTKSGLLVSLSVPSNASDILKSVSVSKDDDFDDVLRNIHAHIGCLAFPLKPELAYRTSQKAPPTGLADEDDFKNLLGDVERAFVRKKKSDTSEIQFIIEVPKKVHAKQMTIIRYFTAYTVSCLPGCRSESGSLCQSQSFEVTSRSSSIATP